MSFEEFVTRCYLNTDCDGMSKLASLNHTKRVSELCKIYYPDDIKLAQIGLGHDLLEDTNCTFYDILMYDPYIAREIEMLTRASDETYKEYICKINIYSGAARKVKICDVLDHLACIDTLKPSLAKRYLNALQLLTTER